MHFNLRQIVANKTQPQRFPVPVPRNPHHRNFFNSCSSLAGFQKGVCGGGTGKWGCGWYVCAKWLLACILHGGCGSGKNTCVNLYAPHSTVVCTRPLSPPSMWIYVSVAADCVCLLSADLSIRLTLTGT